MSRVIFSKLALAVVLMCGLSGSASAQLSALAGRESSPALDADRAALTSPEVKAQFPRLGTSFKILQPSTKEFNAFGYALDRTDLWVNPEMGPAENPLAIFDGAFEKQGYRRLDDIDTSHRPGYKKVVLFGAMGPSGEATDVKSAAVQTATGTWTAKMGSCALIEVEKLNQLTGSAYGGVIAVYEKPTNGPAGIVVR